MITVRSLQHVTKWYFWNLINCILLCTLICYKHYFFLRILKKTLFLPCLLNKVTTEWLFRKRVTVCKKHSSPQAAVLRPSCVHSRCLGDLPSMLGCCESWGHVSCGSGSGRVGPQHYPSFPLTPFWRSDPRCYHCTTWPNRPRTAVPAGLLSTPADLQSPGLGSPGGQRLPAAGIWHPAGPSAQQTPEPACSGRGRRI